MKLWDLTEILLVKNCLKFNNKKNNIKKDM